MDTGPISSVSLKSLTLTIKTTGADWSFVSEIDVYVSTRMPYAMNAEPTSPVSLVIGQTIAGGSKTQVQFAAGSALKLAQSSLANSRQ